jgi:tetratricopeptide (TPR) repeat protein
VLPVFFAGSVFLAFRSTLAEIAEKKERSSHSFESNALLLLWGILPVVVLYILSRCFRPCMFPRYTSHCSFALYLIAGGVFSTLATKRIMMVCTTGLIALYAYQLSLSIPGPQRTDWRGAAETVKAEERPGDLTLIYSFDVALVEASQQMFLRNRDGASGLISHAKSFPVLAEQARFYVLDQRSANVWAVIALSAFDSGPCAAFEKELQSRSLTFTSRELGGIEHIMIYKISIGKEPLPPAPSLEPSEEYLDAFGDLGLSLAENHMPDLALEALGKISGANSSAARPYENVIAALESHVSVADKVKAARAFLQGTGFRKNGNLFFAAEQFKIASETDPDLPVARHWLGITLIEAGRYKEALPIMRRIVQLDISDAVVYSHLMRVIEKNGNAADALESMNLFMKAIGLLDSGDQHVALDITHDAARKDSEYGVPRFLMSALELDANDETAAIKDVRASLKMEPVLNDLVGPFISALFDAKDYDKAWVEMSRIEQAGFDMPEAFIKRLRKDSGRDR